MHVLIVTVSCSYGDPPDKKSTLLRVMTWHPTGDKLLPEIMLNQLTDTYVHYQVTRNEDLTKQMGVTG